MKVSKLYGKDLETEINGYYDYVMKQIYFSK